MKTKFLLPIVFAILFACNTNSSDDDNVNFEDVYLYFSDETLPTSVSGISEDTILPTKFNVLFDIPKDSLILTYFKFTVHDNLTAFLISVSDTNNNDENFQIIVTDNNDFSIKSKIYVEIEFDASSGFLISDDYIYTENYLEMNREMVYFIDNNCGSSSYATGNSIEVTQKKLQINSDGTTSLTDDFAATQTVRSFIKKLSSRDFNGAFELQQNPNWGDLTKFSSTNAFGGITGIEIFEFELIYCDNSSATVHCTATYKDNVNGDAFIDQNFIVSKINNSWIITDMKVNTFERTASYHNYTDMQYSDISFNNITDKGFDFRIIAVDKELCPDNSGNKAIEIKGYANFESDDLAVYDNSGSKILFMFNDNKNELSISGENVKEKYINFYIIDHKVFQK